MNGLLVRVGADQSEGGGYYNGPVDGRTCEFAYVPIPETEALHPGLEKSYTSIRPAMAHFGVDLPRHLTAGNMHLDPDFAYLTYGDQGQPAIQIRSKLGPGDLLVFYAALADCYQGGRLVYAIIGLYVIEAIITATAIPEPLWCENAHTRRCLQPTATDIVVRAKRGVSGRLENCMPIGSFRSADNQRDKRPCYRVESSLLTAWGGLTVSDGFLQRSARLPAFNDAARFYDWFKARNPSLLNRNN